MGKHLCFLWLACYAVLWVLDSFFFRIMGLGFLVDSNFLINIAFDEYSPSPTHSQIVFKRGFLLAFIGTRVLSITFPLLLWLLGPVVIGLSSIALVWGLYELDFHGKLDCKWKIEYLYAYANHTWKNVVESFFVMIMKSNKN